MHSSASPSILKTPIQMTFPLEALRSLHLGGGRFPGATAGDRSPVVSGTWQNSLGRVMDVCHGSHALCSGNPTWSWKGTAAVLTFSMPETPGAGS